MLNKLRKFWQLSAEHKKLVLSAFVHLVRAHWSLRRRPFLEQVSGFRRVAGRAAVNGGDGAVNEGQAALAQDIGRAIGRAANQLPWESSCLVRVLAAQRMLQARGVPGAFFIGADKGREQDEADFAAHAWLVGGGRFVTGEAGHERYTVVGGFAWG